MTDPEFLLGVGIVAVPFCGLLAVVILEAIAHDTHDQEDQA